MRVPIESGLVWAVVEDLQERRAPQVEHELRQHHELLGQTKGARVLAFVLAEALALYRKKEAQITLEYEYKH